MGRPVVHIHLTYRLGKKNSFKIVRCSQCGGDTFTQQKTIVLPKSVLGHHAQPRFFTEGPPIEILFYAWWKHFCYHFGKL